MEYTFHLLGRGSSRRWWRVDEKRWPCRDGTTAVFPIYVSHSGSFMRRLGNEPVRAIRRARSFEELLGEEDAT